MLLIVFFSTFVILIVITVLVVNAAIVTVMVAAPIVIAVLDIGVGHAGWDKTLKQSHGIPSRARWADVFTQI